MRERPVTVLEKLQECAGQGHSITISSITYAELLLGAERSKARKKYTDLIKEFIKRLDEVLPWGRVTAEYYSKLQANLFAKGSPIGSNDTMIAAHVLSVDATIVTNNLKHFKRVPELKVENWAHH